jgi:hypothetical protein
LDCSLPSQLPPSFEHVGLVDGCKLPPSFERVGLVDGCHVLRSRRFAELQAAFSPATPLDSMPLPQQHQCLVKVCKLIKAALQ